MNYSVVTVVYTVHALLRVPYEDVTLTMCNVQMYSILNSTGTRTLLFCTRTYTNTIVYTDTYESTI